MARQFFGPEAKAKRAEELLKHREHDFNIPLRIPL
jgi:hypothetical protein